MLAIAALAVDPFWPCAPAVRRSQHRLSICTYAGGKKNPEHKGRRKKRGGARKTSGGSSNGAAPKPPKKLPLVTGPPKIETQSVLQAVAPTLDPWWSTFVSHVEGVWAGKCAAFNMADGKMEPMMIEGDNIKIKELHTRVREAGGQIDNNAALLRETLKQIKLVHMDAFSDHAEKSCLMAGAAGLLHFDGGSYSSSLSDLGTNSAGDEDVLPDEQLFGAEVTTGGWGHQPGDEDAQDYRTDIGGTDTDTDTDADTSTDTAEEPDVWAEDASEPDVPDEAQDLMDEDAEWRQVARAEMLEEHYRGAGKVATLEHCLAVGGQERIRLQLLLETRGGRREELDVQVLRMVLFKEYWMGVGNDADNGSSPPLHKLNIADARRADAQEHSGNFLCLTLTSAIMPPLDTEVNSDSEDTSLYTDASGDESERPNAKKVSTEQAAHDTVHSTAQTIHSHSSTSSEDSNQGHDAADSVVEQGGDTHTNTESVSGGESADSSGAGSGGDNGDLVRDRGSVDEGVVKAHFSTEVQQRWDPPEGDFGEDGVTWWLPHDVTCTMMMAPSTRAASEGHKSRLGLVVRTTWKRDGFMSVMETQFSPSGELEESRFSSLVPENNSIPSMNVPVRGVAK